MAEVYSRNMMKVALAKMLQTIGWNSIHSTPLEILTDIMTQYVVQLAKSTHDYANEFGCVDPSLDHLGLAFRDFHINLGDLEEYVTYVNFAPPPTPVPKYPVPKEDNLNFLKPGSKEVITRQVHIHEHLPPMQFNEESDKEQEVTPPLEEKEEVVDVETAQPVFKRPADVSPGETFKRPRLTEEEGRPTREISSVMMTTSGYISPAREGKLPEARTPTQAPEPPLPSHSPPPATTTVASNNTSATATAAQNYPPSNMFDSPSTVKPPKISNAKKLEKAEKRKSSKELFKPDPITHEPPKKTEKIKKPPKERPRKNPTAPGVKAAQKSPKSPQTPKVNKTLAAARLKTEKLNTTITPVPTKVDKLSNEPDRKKANIFKKISNVRNDKEAKPGKIKSREASPELVVDEPPAESKHTLNSDVTIELVNAALKEEKPEKFGYFDDDSPPGTPSTPKTPELITHPSPPVPAPVPAPVVKEKRKRKDKSKVKKLLKASSPMDVDMERPLTPEAHVPSPITPASFPNFPAFPSAFPPVPPGLSCPPQLINPFIPMGQMNATPFFGLNAPLAPFMPRPGFPPMPAMSVPKTEPPETPSPPARAKAPADSTSVESPPHSPAVPEISKKKKDKKDKIKKKNKKDKVKNKEKGEKRKLKEEKKEKVKKDKKEKRKDKEHPRDLKLTLKIGGEMSPRPDTPEKKLIIKPIVKREEEPIPKEVKRENSPELAKISALVTGQPKPKLSPVVQQKEESKEEKTAVATPSRAHRGPGRASIHPIKQKPLKASKRQVPVKDSEGNEVWICPACGRQDDGSPMIGCDDCDAWYHWVCVGIQVPPDETENWYCRQCIVKKQEVLHTDKKKRKKREKKDL